MTQTVIKIQRRVCYLMMINGAVFIFLTLAAMLLYPGGTIDNPDAVKYIFTQNFFSDLGLTATYGGGSNTIARTLFTTALTLAGSSLILFFVTFPHLFFKSHLGKVTSLLGTLAGIVAGIGFIGVAWTPADLLLAAHIRFVFIAFEAFPIAALMYTIAIYLHPTFPKKYALVFMIFTFLLAAYLTLLFFGPDTGTHLGLVIQVVGQKAIVYAAIIAMFIEAYGALRLSPKNNEYLSGP